MADNQMGMGAVGKNMEETEEESLDIAAEIENPSCKMAQFPPPAPPARRRPCPFLAQARPRQRFPSSSSFLVTNGALTCKVQLSQTRISRTPSSPSPSR